MLRRGRYAYVRFRGITATGEQRGDGDRKSGKKCSGMIVVDVVESRGAGN